jgi:hypothetical protein
MDRAAPASTIGSSAVWELPTFEKSSTAAMPLDGWRGGSLLWLARMQLCGRSDGRCDDRESGSVRGVRLPYV